MPTVSTNKGANLLWKALFPFHHVPSCLPGGIATAPWGPKRQTRPPGQRPRRRRRPFGLPTGPRALCSRNDYQSKKNCAPFNLIMSLLH